MESEYVGKVFDWVTVDYEIKERKRKYRQYMCTCRCGNKFIATSTTFQKKFVSCGCYRFYKRETEVKNILNKKKNMYMPYDYYVTKNKNGHNVWKIKCKCECGKLFEMTYDTYKNRKTKSCGCYRKNKQSEKLTTHGLSNHRLHRIWRGMKNRCLNKRGERYSDYGGRGIKICDEWKNDFYSFYLWSINNGYDENLSIDRIDVNGDYEPSNCRWADNTIQSINVRKKAKSNTGHLNIRKENDKYLVRIARYKNTRKGYFASLEQAIIIRDRWIKEYNTNPEKWIKDTKEETYL